MGINPRSPGSGGRRGHRDTADIGAYSQHRAARIYKHAADQMPKMILDAAFGEEHVASAMGAFFAQWEQAEETLSDDDVRILESRQCGFKGQAFPCSGL
jgi:hypothetical protein